MKINKNKLIKDYIKNKKAIIKIAKYYKKKRFSHKMGEKFFIEVLDDMVKRNVKSIT